LIIPMGRMLMASDGITHPRYKNAISTWKTMASYWSYWLSRNSTPLITSN
jgi:cytochrome c-type biogenesis protein CcmH/NrfG